MPNIHKGRVISAIGCSSAKSAAWDKEVAKTGAAILETKEKKWLAQVPLAVWFSTAGCVVFPAVFVDFPFDFDWSEMV